MKSAKSVLLSIYAEIVDLDQINRIIVMDASVNKDLLDQVRVINVNL